jgi:aerobic-type carbon monoxide dehydrogenase small subunit (CoxS/CutS family)
MSGRCRACNVILNEEEMTSRDILTGEYTDMCFRCTALANDEEYEADWPIEVEGDE